MRREKDKEQLVTPLIVILLTDAFLAVSIGILERLAGEHADNQEIALAYAKGLVNLSNKQPAEEAAVSITCLLADK